jgi:hypothetical protein
VRLNVAVPEAHVDAPVLDAALESVTRLNESMMARNEIPSFERGLRRGVKWQPEPPGAEHFDHARTVLQRGWGDCDDLAPWHAASLRHSGEDPGAEAVVKRTGPKLWHAVVQRSDGSIDDPSRRAGMGQPHEYSGAVIPMVSGRSSVVGSYLIRPNLALRPVRGGFQARADIPWHYKPADSKPSSTDYAMVSLHSTPVASTALTGAIDTAVQLADAAGFAHPDHILRLKCIADAIDGCPAYELANNYGAEHARAAKQIVGSFFGSIAKLAKSAVKAGLPLAASFVPGGSAALHAADQLQHLIPSGGGGGGGGHPAAPFFPASTVLPQHNAGPSNAPGTAAVWTGTHNGRFSFTLDD